MVLMQLLSLLLIALLPLFPMAVVDKRDKTKAYDSGSSKVAVFLTTAQATAVWGTGTGGWIMPSYQVSTQIGPDRDSEDIKDEADNLVKTRTTRDEFVLITTFYQTDDDTLKLLAWMETAANATQLRYPMPTGDATKPDQWVFGYSVTVAKENWRIEAAKGSDRTRQVTFRFSKDANGKIYDIISLVTDQTQVAWTPYANFKDTRTP